MFGNKRVKKKFFRLENGWAIVIPPHIFNFLDIDPEKDFVKIVARINDNTNDEIQIIKADKYIKS